MKPKPYRFVVRLPTDMKNHIAEAARHYRRSMNSEIVARLQQSFSGIPSDARERAIQPPMHQELEQMFKRSLSSDEEQLIRTYRRLGAAKRQALLTLLH